MYIPFFHHILKFHVSVNRLSGKTALLIILIPFFVLFLVPKHSSASTNGITAVEDSIGSEEKDGKTYINYLVSPGETIYGISTEHGVSISKLMEVNPELEHGLKAGQRILIPYNKSYIQSRREDEATEARQTAGAKREESAKEEEDDGGEEVVHHVEKGETLYSISREYGVDVNDLLRWNGMELQAGQEIVVKKKKDPKTDKSESEKEVAEKKEAQKQDKQEKIAGSKKEKETASKDTKRNAKDIQQSPPPQEDKADVVRLQSETKKGDRYTVYEYDSTRKQVLIVPFDPHLYFSDADEDISKASDIPRLKVRDIIRRRLNALIDPPGYESIHLLGGRSQNSDTLSDLNKIYSSVGYHYQDILNADHNPREERPDEEEAAKNNSGVKGWVNKQKAKLSNEEATTKKEGPKEKFEGKYFGVKVNDPKFFDYYGRKYSTDYYIFINQFEVITDYENCLDLSTQNYRRYFVAHYSIFDRDGEQVAGNKFRIHYNSNSNDINEIVADNVQKIAQRVMNDLPSPKATDDHKN